MNTLIKKSITMCLAIMNSASYATIPILETQRLKLRGWQQTDLAPLARINADPRVMAFAPNGTLSFEQTQASIERFNNHFKEHAFGIWAVELKEQGELIGRVGITVPTWQAPFTPCIEIGWRLAYEHWGKGYATEAADAVLRYAFNVLNIKEIVAFTVPTNNASQKVMEKLGMQRDINGDFNYPLVPKNHPLAHHILYRITKQSMLQ